MNMITESRSIPVLEAYDTVVCGGGVAGIAAALAASRCGAKTLLLEREYMLGGLATAGLVTIYLPICDGMGHQVSFGLAEELLKLSIKYGYEDRLPAAWLTSGSSEARLKERYQVQFNPHLFAIAAEQELLHAGADILYGTVVSDVVMEDDKISRLIAENKSGRFALPVKTVVDTTGDADIIRFAHAPQVEFRQGNVLAAWYYSTGKDVYKLRMAGSCDIPDEDKTEEMIRNDTRERFSGLTGEALTDQVIKSHNMLLQDVLKRRETDESYLPVTMPSIPQVRMTRRIDGESTMHTADDRKDVPDSIGLISNWKKRGPVYEVPFTALCNYHVKNLITAGRSISADEAMWDVTRVIPCCSVTGQAAGTAAAIFSDFSKADIALLQKKLREDGVVIKIKDIPGL